MVELKKYNFHFFEKDLEELNIILDERKLCQFMSYYELLVEWNQVMNLTAITDFHDICKKHFVDSLSLVKACEVSSFSSVIDIGTGAGFPGIPLKIVFPDLKITLLDSLQKRVHFLQTIVETLSLEKVEVIHGRAEDFAKDQKYREQFDLSVSRAVANLSTLSEYCIPFVKPGGYFISYKSEKFVEEMDRAQKAFSVLGGRLERQVEFTIPDSNLYRNLLVIYKEKETPAAYPRRAGIPSKKPIH